MSRVGAAVLARGSLGVHPSGSGRGAVQVVDGSFDLDALDAGRVFQDSLGKPDGHLGKVVDTLAAVEVVADDKVLGEQFEVRLSFELFNIRINRGLSQIGSLIYFICVRLG